MVEDGKKWEQGDTGKIIEIVSSNPYIEKAALLEKSNLPEAKFEETVDQLVTNDILVTMSRQSSSSMESRVPTTVYLLNPEIEAKFE